MRNIVPSKIEIRLAHGKSDPQALAKKALGLPLEAQKVDYLKEKDVVVIDPHPQTCLILPDDDNDDLALTVWGKALVRASLICRRRDSNHTILTVVFDGLEFTFFVPL